MPALEQSTVIEREDGISIRGLEIVPDLDAAVKCNGAGVIVLAGEEGLTEDLVTRFVRPIAELGFHVVAADLTVDATAATAILQGAILHCKKLSRGKIGVLAFDLAARRALEAATELPHIDAVVHASGPLPGPDARLSRIRAAIQLHQAVNGSLISARDFDELDRRLEPGHAQLTGHDYACADNFYARPRNADEASQARIAFDRTRDFLFQTLT